jgi:hypothetical protein
MEATAPEGAGVVVAVGGAEIGVTGATAETAGKLSFQN